MVSKAYLDFIKARNSNRKGKLKRLKKPPKWLEPLSVRRQYTARLYEYTFQIRKVISETIYPKLDLWLAGGTITYPDPVLPSQKFDSKKRNDALIDDIIDDIDATLLLIEEILFPAQAAASTSARFFGLELAAFNQMQYQKTMNSVLGVDIFLEEPWLVPQLELFANQNAQLIANMTTNEIERVSGIVQRAMQEGSSYESVIENIEKSFGITRRHAKLIARDQTSKLNGSLTKLRQQESGVTEYRWQTSGDERVRPDHRALDGKICRWDDPTVYLNEETGKWEKRSKIGGTDVHTSVDVNCFLGLEEVISFDTIKKIFRRFYRGEIIELISEEGFSFKSTPNHPVLTQKGWIAVNKVDIGDDILCAGNQGFNVLKMDIQDKKSTFDNLFTSIEKIFPFDTPISGGQFHGDISNDEVNIISTDCELIGKWNISLFKNFEKFLLSFSDYLPTQIDLALKSSFYATLNRLTFSPKGFVSAFSNFLSLIHSKNRHSIIHGLASISDYDALLNQTIFDSSSTGIKSLRELFDTNSLTEQQLKFVNRQLFKIFVECTSSIFGSIDSPSEKLLSQYFGGAIKDFSNMANAMPFQMKTCRIVKKRSSIISAHVFNLETCKGYYGICKGKLQAIFHNCRCVPIPIIEGMFL